MSVQRNRNVNCCKNERRQTLSERILLPDYIEFNFNDNLSLHNEKNGKIN